MKSLQMQNSSYKMQDDDGPKEVNVDVNNTADSSSQVHRPSIQTIVAGIGSSSSVCVICVCV